nr:putative zinc-binding metallopeptidase [Paraglaciecola sp. G1-23]
MWKKMEEAKRRALYTLKALSLPLQNIRQNAEGGLSFDFTADRDVNDHFVSKLKGQDAVFTGHDCGHITINIAEADDVARSHTKQAMRESYRTLLGHFRHELGHYYFDKLIACSSEKHRLCKTYFGDDELDYQEALDKHYKKDNSENWRDAYISEYATMHPYEDWAETWAHYMHIMDTLETAKNFSITGSTSGEATDNGEVKELTLPQGAYFFSAQTSITSILDAWMDFSIILNSLNRSMGMNDAYPFVLTQKVRTKLSFIHHAIHDKLDRMPALVEE